LPHFATELIAMATSLEIFKKNSDLSSKPNTLSYGVKIAKKIARGCVLLTTQNWFHGKVP